MKKKISEQSELCSDMVAEMKRFELLRRGTPDLPHFECAVQNGSQQKKSDFNALYSLAPQKYRLNVLSNHYNLYSNSLQDPIFQEKWWRERR